jgi:hypothetical protein
LTSDKKSPWSPDTVTAVGAFFLAVLVLRVSVWQVSESRRHDRLAVMPHLDFGTCSGKSEEYYGLVLDNAGLGPALIRRFAVFVDGREMQGSELGEWSQALHAQGRSPNSCPAILSTQVGRWLRWFDLEAQSSSKRFWSLPIVAAWLSAVSSTTRRPAPVQGAEV